MIEFDKDPLNEICRRNYQGGRRAVVIPLYYGTARMGIGLLERDGELRCYYDEW